MTNPMDSTAAGRAAGMGVLAATCVSTLVVNANTSAVTILLPAIAEDVNAPISTLQWAVTGYSLVGAAFIVTSGALGDVFGRRKIFIGGLLLFIASCVLIALSSSQAGVIGGRAIQGEARQAPEDLLARAAVRQGQGRLVRANHCAAGGEVHRAGGLRRTSRRKRCASRRARSNGPSAPRAARRRVSRSA